MNFIMLISGLALTYALAAVIVMVTDARQSDLNQISGSTSTTSAETTSPAMPSEPIMTSVEVVE